MKEFAHLLVPKQYRSICAGYKGWIMLVKQVIFMDKSDFLKIIYFDESFMADFIQIRAGGELKKTTEFISEVAAEAEGRGSAEGEFGTNKKGLPQLFGFLSGVNISAKASGEIELSRKKVVSRVMRIFVCRPCK